jgi:hypothetical protein
MHDLAHYQVTHIPYFPFSQGHQQMSTGNLACIGLLPTLVFNDISPDVCLEQWLE